MGLFRKKENLLQSPESMSRDEKEKEIDRLEAERARINSDIEKILRAYAKETGDRTLKRRRRRFGRAPNDYRRVWSVRTFLKHKNEDLIPLYLNNQK